MKILIKLTFVVCFTLSLFVPFTAAQGTETAMYDFYNGLTNIIEKNMENPDACVDEANRFFENNRKTIDIMRDAATKGIKNMQNYQYNQSDMESAAPEAASSKAVQAANRWMSVYMAFAMKYPEHASKIGELMSQFAPQDLGY